MINITEKVTLGWCDSGSTDGRFTDGLVNTLLTGQAKNIFINSVVRVEGNQIARQRQTLFDHWSNNIEDDWLLWIDSDINVTVETLKKLWETADKDSCPVLSGTYFVSKSTDGSLMVPFPVLFNDVQDFKVQYIHPLPENQIIKCDAAGMGLVLMHRSIVEKLKEKYPNQAVFAEHEGVGEEFVSEDVAFFRKLKSVGIPLYAHTGAIATHVKRFNLDADYYNLYWNSKV
jgi:hypothetical protein